MQIIRPRILRKSAAVRNLVAETHLSPSDLIAPLFIVEGKNQEEEISALPGYFRRSLDKTLQEVETLISLGIKTVLLFVKVPDDLKDNEGKEALNPNGLMQKSIAAIKKEFPEVAVMSDVALDPYSMYGHDGIVENERIVNDPSVLALTKMAISHAEAGVDFVAPSDMMDGRILSMRQGLEEAGFTETGILAYSAKYASCFYGPFRAALDSAPGFGDKKTYQMDFRNRLEAQKEISLDINEGADMIMIKPALAYLDIIRETYENFAVPICAYQVSGEYAMIKASAEKGWIDEKQAMLETVYSIKRAGASFVVTYFAKELARHLRNI